MMNNRVHPLFKTYFAIPYILLAFVIGLGVLAASNLRYFSYDASSDTLISENDKELAYYRDISKNFGNESFLFLTFEPNDGDLLSAPNIARLSALQERLAAIKGVSAVTSILDVPLLKSPPVALSKIASDFKTLRSPDVDFTLAKTELSQSPLFKELLISEDGSATAMRVSLKADQEFAAIEEARQNLILAAGQKNVGQKNAGQSNDGQDLTSERGKIEDAYIAAKRNYVADQERLLNEIREIQVSVKDEATVYLSGVPVIASDMVRFVKADISTFGGVSLALIMLILFIFFRRLRWVALPLLTALLSVLITAGLLGLLRQPVTVISANFVALLIIFSISFTVHLMVRYRELAQDLDTLGHDNLLTRTMSDKFAPCLYTGLTTMAAFASLTSSAIKPIEDLGWIMCLAMVVAFVMNYTFFPAVVRLLPNRPITPLPKRQPRLTNAMRSLSIGAPKAVGAVTLMTLIISVIGMSLLTTNSRFIDYFRNSSDIKQGLVYVDENFGGTVPMDVVLSFNPYVAQTLDEEDDFFEEEPDAFPERYWYTPDKIEKVRDVQTYLESLPEVGKIISLSTLEEIAREFNDGQALSTVELAAVIGLLPDALRDEFLLPYSAPERGIMRISLRMKETAPRHSRDALIEGIENYAIGTVGFEPENVRVTGLNVFFNNMLKSLYQSQLSTIGLVVLATFIMFLMLMRSVKLALIGVLPNLLSAIIVLGFMGFIGITLDMMTMTIAAIIIGIGVDNAIHYLHRFKTEIEAGQSVIEAINASHGSIGFALYFTSATVIAGFSVLGLSNFIPTIYFGLLTALAMGVSLVVNLVVLPSLLMIFYTAKPAKRANA